MRLIKLSIDGFGKLHHMDIDLSQSFQVIYGKNEAGKTTLRYFILAMLFGMEKGRGLAARTDEYTRFWPVNGGNYGGTMIVECQGITYRILRRFETEHRMVKLFREDTMEEIPLGEQGLQGILFQESKDEYLKTGSMTQKDLFVGKDMQDILQNAMANSYRSSDSQLDIREAIDYLKLKRRQWRKGKEFQQLEIYRSRMEREDFREEDLRKNKNQEEEILHQLQHEPAYSIVQRIIYWIRGLFGHDPRVLRQEKLEHQLELVQIEIKYMEQQQRAHERNQRDYQRTLARCHEIEEQIHDMELAIEGIIQGAKIVQKTYGNVFNDKMSQVFCQMTNGRYQKVYMDESMDFTVEREGKLIPIMYLSQGTVEQLYLSLRLATRDILYQEDGLPLIFDDVFGHYDDERLEDTVDYLAGEEGRQMIWMTCHQRVLDILDQQEINYHLVSLES